MSSYHGVRKGIVTSFCPGPLCLIQMGDDTPEVGFRTDVLCRAFQIRMNHPLLEED